MTALRLGLRRGPPRPESQQRHRVPQAAVAFYTRYGITVEQVLTDKGGAYRSTIHAIACCALRIHLRTRAYRPQTNGKAERFIRTLTAG